MRPLKFAAQIVFYAFILALLVSRSTSAGISHDENQFIAPGQALADHGLLPYIDYPYTHMPYAIAFYAITAMLSGYDFLAARLLTSVVWLMCILLMVVVARKMRAQPASLGGDDPPFAELLWEFVLVFVFINHPLASYILGAALNHSFATLFSLLALLFFIRGIYRGSSVYGAAFASAICVGLAACVRSNYASLIVVLGGLWIIYAAVVGAAKPLTLLIRFLGGLVVASLPALALLALAPAQFYYSNLVYIRLNTAYYEVLRYSTNMDLGSKLSSFVGILRNTPIDWILYGVLIYTGVASLMRLTRTKSPLDLGRLALAGFSGAMWLTAFAPTPMLAHYFFASLPFMLIILALLGCEIYAKSRPAYVLSLLAVILAFAATVRLPNPSSQLAGLSDPSKWPPVQVHNFGAGLKHYVPRGTILTLLPMVALEAGYDIYPFTTPGPFMWRTSFLLTAARRAKYHVIGPNELPGVLDKLPPDGILTGFEAANAGFTNEDLGGLETPFIEYATQHGYKPVPLAAGFYGHPIVLWIPQP